MIILPYVGYRIYDLIVKELKEKIDLGNMVTVEQLKKDIEDQLEDDYEPDENGVLNLDDFSYDLRLDGKYIEKPILQRHFDDSECEKCKIPKKVTHLGDTERLCIDFDCWKEKALDSLKAHQDEEKAILEAEKKKAEMRKNSGFNVISPDSHVWIELKKPKKGTVCQICGAKDNLMAYRSAYTKQTICRTDLNQAKKKSKEPKQLPHMCNKHNIPLCGAVSDHKADKKALKAGKICEDCKDILISIDSLGKDPSTHPDFHLWCATEHYCKANVGGTDCPDCKLKSVCILQLYTYHEIKDASDKLFGKAIKKSSPKKPSAKELLAKKKAEEKMVKEQETKAKEATAREMKRNEKQRIKDEEEAVIAAFDDYLKDVKKEFAFLDDLNEDEVKNKAMKSLLIYLVNNLWKEPNKRCYRKWDPNCANTADAVEAVKHLKGSERIVAMLRGLFYQECNPAGTVITNYALLKKKFPQAAIYYQKPDPNKQEEILKKAIIKKHQDISDLLNSSCKKCPTCGELKAEVTQGIFDGKPDGWIIECCDHEVSADTVEKAIDLWNALPISKKPTGDK